MKPFERLRDYWDGANCAWSPGASYVDIEEFERTHSVEFPLEFREYLLSTNGTIGPDAELFHFWKLQELETVKDRYGAALAIPNGHLYVTFADVIIHTVDYAVQCSGSEGGEVIAISTPLVTRVARSFDDFVSLYINEDPSLSDPFG